MPAHRSSEEAELRDAVVARLRQLRPMARIMHEVNASGFGNRIDVLAVSPAEILSVEVKSKKDKLDRLPDQLKAMARCSHHSIAAVHEKFLAHRGAEGQIKSMYRVLPEDAAKAIRRTGAHLWVFPKDAPMIPVWDGRWDDPGQTVTRCAPSGALDMLWAAELRALCASLGIHAPPRATMPFMVNALRWNATGGQLTKGVCAALRARKCIEADPAIEVTP